MHFFMFCFLTHSSSCQSLSDVSLFESEPTRFGLFFFPIDFTSLSTVDKPIVARRQDHGGRLLPGLPSGPFSFLKKKKNTK